MHVAGKPLKFHICTLKTYFKSKTGWNVQFLSRLKNIVWRNVFSTSAGNTVHDEIQIQIYFFYCWSSQFQFHRRIIFDTGITANAIIIMIEDQLILKFAVVLSVRVTNSVMISRYINEHLSFTIVCYLSRLQSCTLRIDIANVQPTPILRQLSTYLNLSSTILLNDSLRARPRFGAWVAVVK